MRHGGGVGGVESRVQTRDQQSEEFGLCCYENSDKDVARWSVSPLLLTTARGKMGRSRRAERVIKERIYPNKKLMEWAEPAWQSGKAVGIYRAVLAHRVSEDGKLILSLCAVFNLAAWSGISRRGGGRIPHISGAFEWK